MIGVDRSGERIIVNNDFAIHIPHGTAYDWNNWLDDANGVLTIASFSDLPAEYRTGRFKIEGENQILYSMTLMQILEKTGEDIPLEDVDIEEQLRDIKDHFEGEYKDNQILRFAAAYSQSQGIMQTVDSLSVVTRTNQIQTGYCSIGVPGYYSYMVLVYTRNAAYRGTFKVKWQYNNYPVAEDFLTSLLRTIEPAKNENQSFESNISCGLEPRLSEITYRNNYQYVLGELSIPIPDGMCYQADRLDPLIPGGFNFPDRNHDLAFCFMTPNCAVKQNGHTDSPLGMSVNYPKEIVKDIWKQISPLDLAGQVATQFSSQIAEMNDGVSNNCKIVKAEKGFILACCPFNASEDENEYWETFAFIALTESQEFWGTIFINAPKDEKLYLRVVDELLNRIGISPSEMAIISKKELKKAALGEYAATDGQIDAVKAVLLFIKDIFWINNQQIVNQGRHNQLTGVDINAAVINKYPDIERNSSVFGSEIVSVINYLEENEKLIIPQGQFHPDLLATSRGGNISGTICFEFFAWHMIILTPKESDIYLAIVDRNLAIGIPDAESYIGELIRTLRAFNGIFAPFDVEFSTALNLDTPVQMNCTRIAGASNSLNYLNAHFEGGLAAIDEDVRTIASEIVNYLMIECDGATFDDIKLFPTLSKWGDFMLSDALDVLIREDSVERRFDGGHDKYYYKGGLQTASNYLIASDNIKKASSPRKSDTREIEKIKKHIRKVLSNHGDITVESMCAWDDFLNRYSWSYLSRILQKMEMAGEIQ